MTALSPDRRRPAGARPPRGRAGSWLVASAGVVDTSRFRHAVRQLTLTSWRLHRQRRTLKWRRHRAVGHCYPAIESQQRLMPWGRPIWLPRVDLTAFEKRSS